LTLALLTGVPSSGRLERSGEVSALGSLSIARTGKERSVAKTENKAALNCESFRESKDLLFVRKVGAIFC
jgi:hypothetical protein